MKSPDELTKHTLHLRKGDWDRLATLFPELSTSLVIRKIISNFIDKDGRNASMQMEVEL